MKLRNQAWPPYNGRKKAGLLIASLGLTLVLMYGGLWGYTTTQSALPQPIDWEAITPAPTPPSVVVADSAEKSVSSDLQKAITPTPTTQPRRPVVTPTATAEIPPPPADAMRIPAIGLEARVVDVSVEGDALPVPAFAVGHEAMSGRPGERKNGVYFGHLDSLASGNVFARLSELKVDDEIWLHSAWGGSRAIWYVKSKRFRPTIRRY